MSNEVIKVIFAARTKSTYSRYQGYWAKFDRFCAERNLDPWSVGIDHILTFVEVSRSTKNWSYSSVKVCVSAISLFRGRIKGGTVFTHKLMAQYLKGAR